MRKKEKLTYDVSVHLSDDKTYFRLKFWHKQSGTYLKEFERRCTATTYGTAKVERDAEQLNEKWRTYNAETLKIINGDFISLLMDLIRVIKYEPTKNVYINCVETLQTYLKSETLPFSKVTQELVDNYREWLLNRYQSQMSASLRFGFFCQGLKKADKENRIKRVYYKTIPLKPFKKKDVLTEDDLNKLLAIPYEGPGNRQYRKMFLFECLTGVSYSDLKRLEWKQIYSKTINIKGEEQKITQLSYVRFKTKEEVTICLTDEVLTLLGERKGDNDRIFPFVTCNGTYNYHIEDFVKEAGISKHITSHCGRATAIIRVIESKDIYHAKNQVGHKNIESTLKYAQFTNTMMLGNAKALTQGLKFNHIA
jgi:integrase